MERGQPWQPKSLALAAWRLTAAAKHLTRQDFFFQLLFSDNNRNIQNGYTQLQSSS